MRATRRSSSETIRSSAREECNHAGAPPRPAHVHALSADAPRRGLTRRDCGRLRLNQTRRPRPAPTDRAERPRDSLIRADIRGHRRLVGLRLRPPVRSARKCWSSNELDHLTGIRMRWSSRLRRMTRNCADMQRPRRCLVSWIECHQQRRAVRRRRRALPLPTSVAIHDGKRRQERQQRRRASICRSRGQSR